MKSCTKLLKRIYGYLLLAVFAAAAFLIVYTSPYKTLHAEEPPELTTELVNTPAATDLRSTPLEIEFAFTEMPWVNVENGLELVELAVTREPRLGFQVINVTPVTAAEPASLIILKVNPALYEFTLHMASEDGVHRSLAEHAAVNSLYAVINASMYLPDNLTSTGLLQSSTHTNNPHIAARFGAFFLAEPDQTTLPTAVLREKDELEPDINATLSHYKIIVQNFRLFDRNGNTLWPENTSAHSISAMADDVDGNILFILCRLPLSPADFSHLMLTLPVTCRSGMYLEGGSQAGLLVKAPDSDEKKVWMGKRNSFLTIDGPLDAPLPNVIGLRPRVTPATNSK
ncbi:phosphodiester glycosidase family protein [Desulfovibrio sp. OttesenSCG-928-F07]|nr:phosphodiester glycosidase family protein [Desulfovibrio sp. OttesenSCG-928-F07]